jgi:hypothetical protein
MLNRAQRARELQARHAAKRAVGGRGNREAYWAATDMFATPWMGFGQTLLRMHSGMSWIRQAHSRRRCKNRLTSSAVRTGAMKSTIPCLGDNGGKTKP